MAESIEERIAARAARLPAALRLLRIWAGFPVLRAAERRCQKRGLTVNAAMISRWERGESVPGLGSALGYLEALGHTCDDLEAGLTEWTGEDGEPVASPRAARSRIPDRVARTPSVLRRLRIKAGLRPIARVSERCRESGLALDAATIARWERGEDDPAVSVLIGYLGALGFSLGDFGRMLDEEVSGVASDGGRLERRLRAVPRALAWLRHVAGHRTLAAAERGLERAGSKTNRAVIYRWETDVMPNLVSLDAYLCVLHFDFHDFEIALAVAQLGPDELERLREPRFVATARKGAYEGDPAEFAIAAARRVSPPSAA